MRVPLTSTKRAALVAALVLTALTFAVTPASARVLKKETWLSKTTITEYFPVPEWWFVGKAISTPGLSRASKVDWLYSARGVSMEGDGIGMDGQKYHIAAVGSSGWITARGKRARFGVGGVFAPFWRGTGYWKNRRGAVTFPLQSGGWYAGRGKRFIRPKDITFAEGPSRPLRYYRSVAVDPKLIPLGSLVYAAAYESLNGDGWFRADDTGGAIRGRHLDVYRRAPDSSTESGQYLTGQRIFVVPKRRISAYLKAARSSAGRLPVPPATLSRGGSTAGGDDAASAQPRTGGVRAG
ncbi:MAG: hypothetical protein LT070_08900 [Solirubrobacteraceae bacterium]|nr:hypothetical protein [Solirubrobacteraceae bacterium]